MWNYTPVILFSVQDSFPVKKKKTQPKMCQKLPKKEKINKIQQCEYIQKYGC
jgi:hypothetical protein